MFGKSIFALAALIFAVSPLRAQSPTPVIVQAMPATAAPVAAQPVPLESGQSALKLLWEIKAANEAVLAKQAATLQQLDELEKAAEQIKIYSKRG